MTAATDDDPFRQTGARALARHRLFATLLLVAAGAGFVALSQIEAPGFWLRLARAMCEAAVVGGLADWFAVTALFRRPLGLPIPHTAVVPRNKDRIGQGLGTFVERHILAPDLILARLRAAEPARRLGAWLAEPAHAARAAEQLAALLPVALDSIDDRQARELLSRALGRGGGRAPELAPLLGALLQLARDSGRHQELFDRALAAAQAYLRDNAAEIYDLVEARSAWWVPRRIDRRVATAIVEGLAELLAAMREPGHDVRRRFDAAVEKLIDDLRRSPETAARVAALKEQFLGSAETQAYLGALWRQAKAAVGRAAAEPESDFRRGLAEALQALGQSLAEDAATREWADRRAEAAVQSLVAPFRAEIGRFIADVVRGWEAETIAARIEGAVGRDLQYIRVNGTLVGGLVGGALFLASSFVL